MSAPTGQILLPQKGLSANVFRAGLPRSTGREESQKRTLQPQRFTRHAFGADSPRRLSGQAEAAEREGVRLVTGFWPGISNG